MDIPLLIGVIISSLIIGGVILLVLKITIKPKPDPTCTFTPDNCKLPNCLIDKCKCVDGWVTPSNSSTNCTICDQNRGPVGDCSKKRVNNVVVSLNTCYGSNLPSDLNQDCSQAFAGGRSNNGQYCQSSNGCKYPQCIIPSAWVSPSFNESTWTPCGTNNTSNIDLFEDIYNGVPFCDPATNKC